MIEIYKYQQERNVINEMYQKIFQRYPLYKSITPIILPLMNGMKLISQMNRNQSKETMSCLVQLVPDAFLTCYVI